MVALWIGSLEAASTPLSLSLFTMERHWNRNGY